MEMGWELWHGDFFVRIVVINFLPIVNDDGYMRRTKSEVASTEGSRQREPTRGEVYGQR
jgi:hypothetical protein